MCLIPSVAALLVIYTLTYVGTPGPVDPLSQPGFATSPTPSFFVSSERDAL